MLNLALVESKKDYSAPEKTLLIICKNVLNARKKYPIYYNGTVRYCTVRYGTVLCYLSSGNVPVRYLLTLFCKFVLFLNTFFAHCRQWNCPPYTESLLDPSQSLLATPSRRRSSDAEPADNSSFLDQTIVDADLIGSQFSSGELILDQEEEEELVDLLADLAAAGNDDDDEAHPPPLLSSDHSIVGMEGHSDSDDSTKDMFSTPPAAPPSARATPSADGKEEKVETRGEADILDFSEDLEDFPVSQLSRALATRSEEEATSPAAAIRQNQSQRRTSLAQSQRTPSTQSQRTPSTQSQRTPSTQSQRPMLLPSDATLLSTPESLSSQRPKGTPTQSRPKSTTASQKGTPGPSARRPPRRPSRLLDTFAEDPDDNIITDSSDDEARETLEMSQLVWDTAVVEEEHGAADNNAASAPPPPRGSSNNNNNGGGLNSTLLWGDEEEEADFLKQLEW
jgi:hypothetical protein